MGKTNFNEIWRELEALLPVYDDETGGNFTRVFVAGKDPLLDTRKLKTVQNSLARAMCRHQEEIKQKVRDFLGKKHNLPIPYHRQLILVPLRARKVLAKDNGAMAYVNMIKVKDWREIDAGDFRAEIEFKSGRKLKVQNSVRRLDEAKMECTRILEKMNAGEAPFIGWSGDLTSSDCVAKEKLGEYIIYKKLPPEVPEGIN